jgi:hypothetical protein
MSVQKYIVNKESSNFTILPNKVIQGLKERAELLGFYTYLLSLPPSWIFHKNQLKETCKIGVKKLERYLRELVQMNLVELVQNRNELGRFIHFELTVLNGESFKIINLDRKQKSDAPRVNYRTTVNGGTDKNTYKRNTEQKEKTEKENISCSSDDERVLEIDHFDNFWNIFPRKQKKIDAQKIWKRKKFNRIAVLILEDVQKRIKSEWMGIEKRFIPLPSTYLNGERWTDEVLERPVQTEHPVTATIRELKEKSEDFRKFLTAH